MHGCAPMRDDAAGVRVGDYCITRTLPARSGFGEYAATHVLLPRQARMCVAEESAGKQLMREAYILEALRHPGVPRVFECGMLADRRPWIAVEMLDGPTLADAIADRALPIADTLVLIRDLAEVLHHAHVRGIVHCRLRPESIVYHPGGLCIEAWGGAATHDGAPELGTADKQMYLAPELVRGAPFEARADIFSIGVIAYEALTLAAPTAPLGRRLPSLPRPIIKLVDRMMSATSLARPTAAEVRAEAIRLLDTLEIPAPTAPADEPEIIIEPIDVELTHDLSRDSRSDLRRFS